MMAVFGNAPSISARLQALATANSVVLSGSTKNLLPPSVRCEARGNTILKGMTRPIEIFTAIEVREGGERRPASRVLPFVNREGELAQIRRAWAAVRKGEGRYLQIEGEAGIGKSRLVRAVQERIVTQPSRWLITRTSPYATNTDFFAFFELFQPLLRSDDIQGDEAETPFDRLKRTLGEQGLSSLDITIGFAILLGITIPDEATPAPLQPERARELTLVAISAWLRHEAEKRPLVLAIEDLHWADASSLETIDRLKQSLQKTPRPPPHHHPKCHGHLVDGWCRGHVRIRRYDTNPAGRRRSPRRRLIQRPRRSLEKPRRNSPLRQVKQVPPATWCIWSGCGRAMPRICLITCCRGPICLRRR